MKGSSSGGGPGGMNWCLLRRKCFHQKKKKKKKKTRKKEKGFKGKLQIVNTARVLGRRKKEKRSTVEKNGLFFA